MDNRPWVLIDAGYIGYRALYSVGHLSHGDSPTGVLFGVLSQLRTICEDPHVRSNRVALFFDSRRSFRRDAFPDYKSKRHDRRTEEQREEVKTLAKQMVWIRKRVFPRVGIPCYRQWGLESDDLLAQAALQVAERGDRGVLVTADGDLFQSISDRVSWFDHGRGKHYTRTSFEADRGIAPEKWGRVKVLAGCKTDNVPGIPGVGELTAVKVLTQGKVPKGVGARVAFGGEIAKRNEELVVLPHARTKPFVLREPNYDARAFFEVCEENGLSSFLRGSRRDEWEQFLLHGPLNIPTRKRGEE